MNNLLRILLTVVLTYSTVHAADTYVEGYTRSNGTCVNPHYRTSSDSTINNNYTTRGNTNIYTGQPGYIQPNYGYEPPAIPHLQQAPTYGNYR